jgi:hypothetical protein
MQNILSALPKFADSIKDGTGHGPGGRPRVEIDLGLVERSAQIGCTNDEIVALLGIGRSTFYDRLKDDPELQEVIDRGRAVGRATLRRMQWQAAENGNPTMLIWLGKQMLDQKDKVENSGTMDTNTRLWGVHLTGVRDLPPRAARRRSRQAGRMSALSRRLGRNSLWALAHNKVLVTNRSMRDSKLQDPVEQHPSAT